jgi:hypothetical protein
MFSMGGIVVVKFYSTENSYAFIYGRISKVTKLEKVMYIDMEMEDEGRPFRIVFFSEYFKHFHYESKLM